MELEIIEFVDTTSHDDWATRKEAEKDDALTCKAVGWLFKEDKTKILLAALTADCARPEALACRITIVKSTITKRTKLEDNRKPRA